MSSPTEERRAPRIYSADEIEIFLRGDRREIDRLLLHGLNSLSEALIPHARREEEMLRLFEEIGGLDGIAVRAQYVDSLIKRQSARTAMMEKVAQSTLTWAVIAFIGFLALASWDSAVHAIKLKLGGS